MTDHDGAPPGEEAELEVRKRLLARRAAAEEAEVSAIRNQVAAEAAEAERRAELARQLEDAQTRALAAHERAAVVAGEIAALVDQVVERVRELRGLKREIDRGVDHEQYSARAGLIQRMTVPMRMSIDAEIVTRAVQTGRELAALAGVDHEMAAIRAAQRAGSVG